MLRDDLAPIDLPPGIYSQGTEYQIKGRWYDGNLIRWVGGVLRPIGGWQRLTTSALTGKARDMLAWADSTLDRWIAIGTSSNLYVTRGDGPVVDITPAGFVAGLDDATESLGYGGGLYGAGTYGTPRAGGSYTPLALWSLDNWGQYLVACARHDGKIYEWQLNTSNDAVVITNAPEDCVAILVTDQRHILALGAGGDGTRVEWCDKEDNTVWAASATNEAGGLNVQSKSPLKSGVRVRGTNLLLTRTDAHAFTYVGQPFIYGTERVGDDCGSPAPGSLISVGDRAFWVGDGGFWQFDGSVVSPLECDVRDDFFLDLNGVQIEKVVAGHNPTFSEIWWFYPSNDSLEPDKYVIYNYREEWWSKGSVGRTCWDAGSILGHPHAMAADNHLYRHEDDWTANGVTRVDDIFVQTSALEFGVGARIAHVGQIIPDEESRGEVQVTFRGRMAPNATDEYVFGPYTVRDDGITDARFAARQAVMSISPTEDGDFSIGTWRLNVTPGGRR